MGCAALDGTLDICCSQPANVCQHDGAAIDFPGYLLVRLYWPSSCLQAHCRTTFRLPAQHSNGKINPSITEAGPKPCLVSHDTPAGHDKCGCSPVCLLLQSVGACVMQWPRLGQMQPPFVAWQTCLAHTPVTDGSSFQSVALLSYSNLHVAFLSVS